eukprot:3613106-Prymnesium_polylepis.3
MPTTTELVVQTRRLGASTSATSVLACVYCGERRMFFYCVYSKAGHPIRGLRGGPISVGQESRVPRSARLAASLGGAP